MMKIKYKDIYITSVFDISSTVNGIDKNKLTGRTGAIPYITRSDKNNGIDMFIEKQNDRYSLNPGNVITIGLDTQTVYYQPKPFYTGQNIQIAKIPGLTPNISMYLIPLLKIQMKKFNWGGNGATLGRLNKLKIMAPLDSNNDLDFKYMETYISKLRRQKNKEYITYIRSRIEMLKNTQKPTAFQDKKWKEFLISDVADIVPGKDIYAAERVDGSIPYISSTSNQNGIGYFVGNNNPTLERNCLSVNRNGSVGYAFYHPYKALFSNDCRKLKLKKNTKYIGLFISNQITLQKEKYGYGYKMGTARLKRQKILLPINNENQPDYDYMDQYMRYLEFQKLKEYLKFKDLM